jgi:hypothetical protein
MRQIINTTYALKLDARHILKSSTPNQNNVMLLKIVSYAGYIRYHFLASGQPYEDAFSVGGIWLSRLLYEDFEDNAFSKGLALERLTGRAGFEVRTGTMHLIE